MINRELKDLSDLLDMKEDWKPGRGIPEPPDAEDVQRCIQTLLSRQCIYPHDTRLRRVHSILSCHDYQGFFVKYFAAMGRELVYDTRSHMVALKIPTGISARPDWQSSRLKKDKSLVLVALRVAYEEGFRAHRMGQRGEVETTTDDILQKLELVAGLHVEEARLINILTSLKNKGIVQIGEHDPVERTRQLTILPGIEIAVPDQYLRQLQDWADQLPAKADETAQDADTTPDDDQPQGGQHV